MKQVIIIRKDLKMRQGKSCVQASHSSIGAMLLSSKETVDCWNKIHNSKKVCVYVNSLVELLMLRDKANERNIPNYLVIDSGLTEFHFIPTETALAIGPFSNDEIDAITGNLPLL